MLRSSLLIVASALAATLSWSLLALGDIPSPSLSLGCDDAGALYFVAKCGVKSLGATSSCPNKPNELWGCGPGDPKLIQCVPNPAEEHFSEPRDGGWGVEGTRFSGNAGVRCAALSGFDELCFDHCDHGYCAAPPSAMGNEPLPALMCPVADGGCAYTDGFLACQFGTTVHSGGIAAGAMLLGLLWVIALRKSGS